MLNMMYTFFMFKLWKFYSLKASFNVMFTKNIELKKALFELMY